MGATWPTTGPPGPPGPPGANAAPHFYTCLSGTSWTISHGMGREPVGATFYDGSGAVVEVDIQQLDVNTMQVTSQLTLSGKVVWN